MSNLKILVTLLWIEGPLPTPEFWDWVSVVLYHFIIGGTFEYRLYQYSMGLDWVCYAYVLLFGYVFLNFIIYINNVKTFFLFFFWVSRETHLWYILPNEVKNASLLNQYLEILSPCEKENVFRIRGDQLQRRALLARALVHTTIARCRSFFA